MMVEFFFAIFFGGVGLALMLFPERWYALATKLEERIFGRPISTLSDENQQSLSTVAVWTGAYFLTLGLLGGLHFYGVTSLDEAVAGLAFLLLGSILIRFKKLWIQLTKDWYSFLSSFRWGRLLLWPRSKRLKLSETEIGVHRAIIILFGLLFAVAGAFLMLSFLRDLIF